MDRERRQRREKRGSETCLHSCATLLERAVCLHDGDERVPIMPSALAELSTLSSSVEWTYVSKLGKATCRIIEPTYSM